MATRINMSMAAEIATAIADGAFKEDIERARQTVLDASSAIVNSIFTPELRAAVAVLPAWMKRRLCTIEIRGKGGDDWRVLAYLKVEEELDMPCNNNHAISIPIDCIDPQLVSNFQACLSRSKALEVSHVKTVREVHANVSQARTVEKLIEAWPEAEAVLKKFLTPKSKVETPLDAIITRNMPAALPAPSDASIIKQPTAAEVVESVVVDME